MSKNWLYSWQQSFSKILRPFSHSEKKICEDRENNYHWTSGQKPHLIKNDRRIKCITANYVSIVFPVLSTDSSISARAASPTSLPQDRNQKSKSKWRQRKDTGRSVTWSVRMITRIFGESYGWQCPRTRRRFREFFSWIIFRVAIKNDIDPAQYFLCPLPEETKLRHLSENKNYKDPLQENVLLQSCAARNFFDMITVDQRIVSEE